MTIEQLEKEYKNQAEQLSAKIDGLKPLLFVYHGEDLYLLRKRIKVYSDMRDECLKIAAQLKHYYEED